MSLAAHIHMLAVDAPMTLWLIDVGDPPEERKLRWLGSRELERARRFRSLRHRDRYLAVHVALRRLVAQECGIAPEQQRFEQSALGKWRLTVPSDWHVSLSYSGRRGMIALAKGSEIGIDMEERRTIQDADGIATAVFDAHELARYRQRIDTERNDVFLQGWTRKEACLKAIGTGFSLSSASVHTGLGGTRRVLAGDCVLDVGSFRIAGLIGAWAKTRPDQ